MIVYLVNKERRKPMGSGNMSPEEVKSTVNSIDMSNKTENSKAIQSGCQTEGRSSAGGHKESGFKHGDKKT